MKNPLGKTTLEFLKAGAGAQIPPPATREQASSTLSEIRDRTDRRRLKKTGRTEYFGVRVTEGFKKRYVRLPATSPSSVTPRSASRSASCSR